MQRRDTEAKSEVERGDIISRARIYNLYNYRVKDLMFSRERRYARYRHVPFAIFESSQSILLAESTA